MNVVRRGEQEFMLHADALHLAAVDIGAVLQSLDQWLSSLLHVLAGQPLPTPSGMRDSHLLSRQAAAIHDTLESCRSTWTRQWQCQDGARALADSFEDRVMLLVFGKFNAGKSTFCNLLAERFRSHGKPVRFFHLEDGRIVQTDQPFQEGATETTVRLQGVCLGQRLVLLDTPGLHSVTPENAALTQRFTDSADGVLWLTSSTSPGQVQELDELARELRRHKPLLPVITRSDTIEEDEIGGEIVKSLRNKTPANRALQETDVRARAQNKLRAVGVNEGLLKTPVSVSAYVARQQGQTPDALDEAGYARLYTSLRDIVQPASVYKQRKPAEMLLHHLEENVRGAIDTQLVPMLSHFRSLLEEERGHLRQLVRRMLRDAWRELFPELPMLLERHAPTQNLVALREDVTRLIWQVVHRQVQESLGDYLVALPVAGLDICLDGCVGYTPTVGAGKTTASIAEIPDYERLHAALQEPIRQQMSVLFEALVNLCADSLECLARHFDLLQHALIQHTGCLDGIKAQLRA